MITTNKTKILIVLRNLGNIIKQGEKEHRDWKETENRSYYDRGRRPTRAEKINCSQIIRICTIFFIRAQQSYYI